MLNNNLYISLFIGLGLGYTRNTVTDNFYDKGELNKRTKRTYHTFVLLFIKFFWVTGDKFHVDINIRPTEPRVVEVEKTSPWKHKMT